MKYCEQCGHALEEGKKFCTKCGNPVKTEPKASEVIQSELPVTSKKKTGVLQKLKLTAGVLFVLFMVVGIGFGAFYFSNGQKLERSILSEEWAEAREVYAAMVSKGQEEKATQTVINTIEDIREKYKNKELTKDEALACLEGIAEIGNSTPELDTAIQYVNDLEESRKAYDLAEKYWTEKDYENALLQYQLVLDIDENYQAATDRMSEGKSIYRENVIAELETLAENGNYTEAMQKISVAQGILGSDTELSALFTKYEKDGLVKLLEEYEKAGNYAEAITLLQENSTLVAANPDLKTRQDTNTEKYREVLFADARSAYEVTGYEVAVGILTEGLQLLPGDGDIQVKIEEYKSCAPVGLETLNVLSTDVSSSLDNAFRSDTIEDLYGNQYQGYFGFWCGYFTNLQYVEYLTDGKYSNFKTTFFPSKKMNEKFTVSFTVYADDVEIYNSGFINRKEKPIDIDLPINHAESLKVEVYSTDGNSNNAPGIVLTNAQVYNVLE